MSEPEVFGTDADSAARALRSAQIAEARVRRHSVNSGLVPLGWGLIVLVGLSLYEFFPPLAASAGVGVLAACGGVVTARYARRFCFAGVQPSRAAIREYLLLMTGWTVYYVAVLLVATLVVAPRVRHVWLPLALLAAAPLLIGGGMMWRKASR